MVKIDIDPDKEKQLQGAKTEIGDKVKRIWKLIKDDKLGEDGTRAELAELIKQCICYHDHLEGAKTEIYDKVAMIFKLIKYDKLDEDGIRAELLKKEPLAKLVEDFHKQLTCYLHDHLEGHNLGPRNQVSELEMESKEREKELSVINLIRKKLEDTEKYDKEKQLQGAKEEIEDKVKRIIKLINDHYLNEDGTPAEVLKREPLAEFIKDFYIQYQFLYAQYEEQARVNIEEISDLTQQKLELHDRNVDLKKRSADREFALSCMREFNKSLLEIIQQHKQDSVHVEKIFKKKASEDEKQINDHRNEISKLAQENLLMGEKIDHLERILATRKSEFSALQKAKEEMELYYEKIRKEHAKTLAVVDNEKNELANKNMDLQRTLAEREDAYQNLNKEYEQVNSLFNEFFVKLEVAERKMEIMAEEFRQGIGSKDQMVADLEHQVEDLKKDLEKKENNITFLVENVENLGEKLRLSNQNIRDKEQLLSEKGESFRKAEEKFQHDQRALQIRIATAEATMAAENEAFHETITSTKEWFNSVISGIDTVSLNFFDNHKNIENRISNISHELQVAKEYINKMNKERRQLQTDKNHLLEELQGKREEELTLGEKVEKLEAKARKGESEKMIVTTIVVELKKRVEELEKLMEEKEEGMLNLGEEKREAIRQLCLQIDYHRERNDYLKEFISKTRRGQRAV